MGWQMLGWGCGRPREDFGGGLGVRWSFEDVEGGVG